MVPFSDSLLSLSVALWHSHGFHAAVLLPEGEDPFKTVPKEYQRMLMRYTKLDDFDFRHYNKTNFAGLTAEYSNSYCNGMLQVAAMG